MFITAPTDNITVTDAVATTRHRPAEPLRHRPAANVGDVFDRLLVLDSGIRCLTSRTRLVGNALPDPHPGRRQPGHPPGPGRRPTR